MPLRTNTLSHKRLFVTAFQRLAVRAEMSAYGVPQTYPPTLRSEQAFVSQETESAQMKRVVYTANNPPSSTAWIEIVELDYRLQTPNAQGPRLITILAF